MPQWFIELTPSDWLLGVFALGVLWFIVDYGVFTPWWKEPIGWIVIVYSASVLALMFLIFWGIVNGSRVDEWARVTVAVFLIFGIVGKIIVLHTTRHDGRMERRALRHAQREGSDDHGGVGSQKG